MQTVGWIGIGQMGEPMANNLLKAGYGVNVYNRTAEKAASLVEVGATLLSSPKEVVEQSDVTFLMLSNAAAVEAVLTQEDGVLEAIQAGKTIVDMSTISPEDSRDFAVLVAEKGGVYLDAPVSGSTGAAIGAQLVILAGGEEETVRECQPFFDVLGKKTIHFGAQSKGSSAKLAINLLLSVVGQGVAESLVLAEKAGIEKEMMLELISQSAMSTPLFQGKKDMYRTEEFPSAFMLGLMAKDLGLISAEAERLGVDLPLAEVANETYQAARDHGKAKLDMAAVYLELKEQNK